MKLRVREVFYRDLAWPFSKIDEFISKGEFGSLKLFEIQPLLKYYKANGHPKISVYQSKYELVKTLTQVLSEELAYESTLSEADNPKGETPSAHLNVLIASADDQIERSNSNGNEDENEENEEEVEGDDEEEGEQKTPTTVPSFSHQALLLNPLNRQVFTELQMSSFTSSQIIEAINESYTAPDALLDYDQLMLAILCKVEVVGFPSLSSDLIHRQQSQHHFLIKKVSIVILIKRFLIVKEKEKLLWSGTLFVCLPLCLTIS
jgi:hypothetical protein